MQQIHTVAAQGPALSDRLNFAVVVVAVGAGAAGATVTAVVTFAEAMPDANYFVDFDTGQDVVCYATAKTSLGFTLHVSPRLAANSVAAGNVTCLAVE